MILAITNKAVSAPANLLVANYIPLMVFPASIAFLPICVKKKMRKPLTERILNYRKTAGCV